MENSTFEIFIRHCGTVEKAAKILGTSHQNVSSMRNGRTWIKPGCTKNCKILMGTNEI